MKKYYLEILKSDNFEENKRIVGAYEERKNIDNIEVFLVEEDFFAIDANFSFFINGEIKKLNYTTELVKEINSGICRIEKNYDFRKEGIDYLKITENEYNNWLEHQKDVEKQEKIKRKRGEIKSILISTDFTQLTDVGLLNKDEFSEYRLVLRQLLSLSDEEVLNVKIPDIPKEIWK